MLAHERPGVTLVSTDHGSDIGVLPHLRVSLEAYFTLIDEFVAEIERRMRIVPELPPMLAERARKYHHAWKPDQVIAITSGGIMPGLAVSKALDLPIAYLGAARYVPHGANDRDSLRGSAVRFARELLTTEPGLGRHIILVDDLADHGRTFEECTSWLMRHPQYGGDDLCITTACLWVKSHSTHTPHYAVDRVQPVPVPGTSNLVMPWIDQPLHLRYAKGYRT